MLRRKLAIVASLAFLAMGAQAGEIKVYQWPVEYVPQEVTTLDVVMDIGFWIEIVNQDSVIKLQQVSVHTYEGCLDLQVKCNFNLSLSCAITATGTVAGTYSCSMQNPNVDPPGGTPTVCARLENADLAGNPGGTTNVHVASVTIKVVPR